MKIIETINTIELSSVCDNKCQYCPARLQSEHRLTGFMSWATFKHAIDKALVFARAGTQREINLFGVGEPTLHKYIVAMVRYAREHLPFNQVLHLNTNGNTMTMQLAKDLKDAGITSIDITGHDHAVTAKTIKIFRELEIVGNLSYDFVTAPNNWAGQVDWFEPDTRLPVYRNNPCPWLERGQVMVMSDGLITTCCIDAFGRNVICDISDNLENFEVAESELCKSCHHKIPETSSKFEQTLDLMAV